MRDHFRWMGFESKAEGRPVQRWWFDVLNDNDRFEIQDLLNYLGNVPKGLWKKPEFDPLDGAGGISEIRIQLRCSKGSLAYRIYGYWGPEKNQYSFLHGKAKDVKNDRDGKRIAKHRLEEIKRNEATVHQFVFEKSAVV